MATTKHAPVPSVIKAVRIAKYGGSEQLKYEEVPMPRLGPDRVLAKVRYAGVNPVDWKIREGYMKQVSPASFPLTLGQDFAGEIVLGGDTGPFRMGERVFGFGNGTYADFTAAAITLIAAIPEKVDFAVAAALPTPGITALQAIRDHAQPKPGSRILIHGAAGSVGSFATQIAKLWGAQVIGTASGDDVVYLRALGHVQVVDYKQERFEAVGQVDAVLDLIGGDTATRTRGGEEGRRAGFDGRRGEGGSGGSGGDSWCEHGEQGKRRGPLGAHRPGGTRRCEAANGPGVSAGAGARGAGREPARPCQRQNPAKGRVSTDRHKCANFAPRILRQKLDASGRCRLWSDRGNGAR